MPIDISNNSTRVRAERERGKVTDGEILGEGREMCSEKADATDMSSQSMQHSKSDSHSIVRRSSSTKFVQNDERFRSSLRIHIHSIVYSESKSETSERTFLRILVVSSISTLKVEALAKMKSFAPILE